MRAAWQRMAARYDALSRRERGMVAAAALIGTLMVGLSLLVDPISARNASVRQSIVRQSGDLAGLQTQLAALEAQLKVDPNAARKAEVQSLREAVRAASEQLEKLESGLVPPERMNALLESLLRRNPGLRLVSLKTLAPTPLIERKGDKSEATRDFDLFRHGVEIRLEGSYPELQAYLAQLEQGPQQVLWGEARLTTSDYPKSILTLVVYTLNAEKAWLAI